MTKTSSIKAEFIRRFIALFVAILIAASLTSCQKTPAGEDKNPLWKVSSDKGSIYLLGSVHILKHSDYPLSSTIDEALYSSDTVVFELDFAEASREESKALLNEYSTFSDERTLRQSLSGNTYSELKGFLGKRGMRVEDADRMKPWYVANILTVEELSDLGFKPDYGVDLHLYTKSLAMGKDIQALETLEYQLGLFNSMSMEDQDAFVRQTISELSTINKEFPEIVKAWKSGNTQGLLKLLESCNDFRETCRKIIDRRNMDWMPKIEALLQSGRHAMVIAGAAHMVGENGLLNLLMKKGYRIEQL